MAYKEPPVIPGLSSLKRDPEWFDDFLFGSGTSSDVGELGWTFTQNGGTFFQTEALHHPGIAQIQTTGSSNGRGAILSRNQINIRLGAGELTYECAMKMDQLSNGTDTFVQNFGLGEGVTTAIQGNGVYFTYTDSINSGNWTLRTSAASSPTATDSGVPATTNWTNLKIVVNAAATSVEYFIDGVSVGTITTTIPTGALGFMFGIFRSAGSVNIQTNIDAFYAKYALTNPRFF